MALMRLQLGSEVDIATGDELRNGLGELSDRLASREPRPTYLPLPQQAQGAGNVAVMDHGSPPIGRLWEVKFWAPLGALPASPVPAMNLWIGPQDVLITQATSEQPPMAFLRLANRTSFVFFGTDALWVHPNENVVATTVGNLAIGAVATSILVVSEWRQSDKEERSGRP